MRNQSLQRDSAAWLGRLFLNSAIGNFSFGEGLLGIHEDIA